MENKAILDYRGQNSGCPWSGEGCPHKAEGPGAAGEGSVLAHSVHIVKTQHHVHHMCTVLCVLLSQAFMI
jgi:hypothetical protein